MDKDPNKPGFFNKILTSLIRLGLSRVLVHGPNYQCHSGGNTSNLQTLY